MLENNNVSALEFIDEFRKNLFSEEVFVFTPKGQLIILPDKATALDFAFEIHSQIGLHCLGAKVNQKLVPLSYELKNGDQIEILTSKKQDPTEEWLRYVVTSKARTKIKEYLREQRKLKADEGKELLMQRFKELDKEFTHATLNRQLAYFNLSSPQELYYRLATGVIDLHEVKDLRHEDKTEIHAPTSSRDPRAFEKEVEKIRGVRSDMLMIGEDMGKLQYFFAPCCNPIPGDEVIGFMTESEGIAIHRTNCPMAMELMSNFGYKIVKTKWTSQQEIAFLAGIRIKGADRVGLVNDVTKVISNNLKVNMRSITIDSNDGIFEGTIKVFVHDTQHLDKLIQRLNNVSGVFTVERVES